MSLRAEVADYPFHHKINENFPKAQLFVLITTSSTFFHVLSGLKNVMACAALSVFCPQVLLVNHSLVIHDKGHDT